MSVAPTRGPVQRPGEERDFTEIFQRLDDLERALNAAGIQCSFLNICEWFSLETTGEIPTTDNGIEITATNGKDFDLATTGGGNFSISVSGGFQLDAPQTIVFTTDGVLISTVGVDGVSIYLTNPGGVLEVRDSASALIFRLDEATGDLHLKTGASVIADL